jgi:2-methylcitrate dehydratase PrpD
VLEALPDAAVDRSAALLASTLAAAVGASPPPALAAVLLALGAPRQATILGSGEQTGAVYAAYLNAATVVDPGAPFDARLAACLVVPACVAAAELDGRTGNDLLAGVAAGIEVSLRLAEALGPRHEERGFSLLGSAGRVGAGLAAARTLGLSADAALATIGFAATQGAGPLRGATSEVRALLGAKAAADGLEAALFCGAGLIGPPEPLEGRRGLFVLELAGDPELLDEGLGSRWRLAELPSYAAPPAVMAAAEALSGDGTVAALLAAARS